MAQMLPRYDTKLMTQVWDSAAKFVLDYNAVGIPTTISDQNATTLYYLLYARYGNTPIANYDEEQFKYKIFSIVFQYGPTWEKKLSVQETLRGLSLADLTDDGQVSELFTHTGGRSIINSSSVTATKAGSITASMLEDVSTTASKDGLTVASSTATHTGTVSVSSTGTATVTHSGTVGVTSNQSTTTSAAFEDIKNHAFNPGTAPSTTAYSPLNYINEQTANKNVNDGSSATQGGNTTTYNNADETSNDLHNQTTNDLTDVGANSTTASEDSNQASHKTGSNDTVSSENSTSVGAESTTASDNASDSTVRTLTAGKLKGYEKLLELLDTDVTGQFISKFKLCFKQFVMPERTWIYVDEEDE